MTRVRRHGRDEPAPPAIPVPGRLRIALEGEDDLTVEVPADSTLLQRVYVIARPDDAAAQAARSDLRFWVEDLASGERAWRDTIFNGREG